MTGKLRSVAEEWEDFWKAISKGRVLGEVQKVETQMAFYAGAISIFSAIASAGDLPEDEGLVYLDNRAAEFKQYGESLKREMSGT